MSTRSELCGARHRDGRGQFHPIPANVYPFTTVGSIAILRNATHSGGAVSRNLDANDDEFSNPSFVRDKTFGTETSISIPADWLVIPAA